MKEILKRFESREAKSIKEIYHDEIEMVKNNRHMDKKYKQIKLQELTDQLNKLPSK